MRPFGFFDSLSINSEMELGLGVGPSQIKIFFFPLLNLEFKSLKKTKKINWK
jgi:hypothetical protein